MLNAVKEKFFQKHMYPGSKIINIKSLIDDPNLKTIQVEGVASGIMPYIYNHPEKDRTIKVKFLQYSHKDPTSLTFDDYYVNVNRCEGEDLGKLKKIIQIINDNILNMRGNYSF